MHYGTEYLVVKKQHIHKISVIDMKMLRWISRNRRKYRVCLDMTYFAETENLLLKLL